MTEPWSEASEGDLRVIWGPPGDRSGGSILGSILGLILVNSRPILGNLINVSGIAFIWPWVGPKAKYTQYMGPGHGLAGYPV